MPNSPAQVDDEENKALLSQDLEDGSPGWQQFDTVIVKASRTNTWRRIARNSVLALVMLAVGALVAKTMIFIPAGHTHPNLSFHGSELRSNGTHDFKRTVLMVSIDGLRCVFFGIS